MSIKILNKPPIKCPYIKMWLFTSQWSARLGEQSLFCSPIAGIHPDSVQLSQSSSAKQIFSAPFVSRNGFLALDWSPMHKCLFMVFAATLDYRSIPEPHGFNKEYQVVFSVFAMDLCICLLSFCLTREFLLDNLKWFISLEIKHNLQWRQWFGMLGRPMHVTCPIVISFKLFRFGTLF